MARVEIGSETIEAAMRSTTTRSALAAKAARIRARTEQIANAENVDVSASTSTGTRPRGRPYARVVSSNIEQEWGSSRTARRRVLGRAAESA